MPSYHCCVLSQSEIISSRGTGSLWNAIPPLTSPMLPPPLFPYEHHHSSGTYFFVVGLDSLSMICMKVCWCVLLRHAYKLLPEIVATLSAMLLLASAAPLPAVPAKSCVRPMFPPEFFCGLFAQRCPDEPLMAETNAVAASDTTAGKIEVHDGWCCCHRMSWYQ